MAEIQLKSSLSPSDKSPQHQAPKMSPGELETKEETDGRRRDISNPPNRGDMPHNIVESPKLSPSPKQKKKSKSKKDGKSPKKKKKGTGEKNAKRSKSKKNGLQESESPILVSDVPGAKLTKPASLSDEAEQEDDDIEEVGVFVATEQIGPSGEPEEERIEAAEVFERGGFMTFVENHRVNDQGIVLQDIFQEQFLEDIAVEETQKKHQHRPSVASEFTARTGTETTRSGTPSEERRHQSSTTRPQQDDPVDGFAKEQRQRFQEFLRATGQVDERLAAATAVAFEEFLQENGKGSGVEPSGGQMSDVGAIDDVGSIDDASELGNSLMGGDWEDGTFVSYSTATKERQQREELRREERKRSKDLTSHVTGVEDIRSVDAADTTHGSGDEWGEIRINPEFVRQRARSLPHGMIGVSSHSQHARGIEASSHSHQASRSLSMSYRSGSTLPTQHQSLGSGLVKEGQHLDFDIASLQNQQHLGNHEVGGTVPAQLSFRKSNMESSKAFDQRGCTGSGMGSPVPAPQPFNGGSTIDCSASTVGTSSTMLVVVHQRPFHEQWASLSIEQRSCVASLKKKWERKHPNCKYADHWYLRFAKCSPGRPFTCKAAYRTMKNTRPHFLDLCMDPDMEEFMNTKTVFPCPNLKTVEGYEVYYIRPSRYFPKKCPVLVINEANVYVMNSMLEKEQTCTDGISIVVNMKDFSMKNFDVGYAYTSCMLMQGLRSPTRIMAFLIVDYPSWFGSIWHIMKRFLAPSFRRKVHIIKSSQMPDFFAPGFVEFLPDDMWGGQANTDEMVRNFIAERKLIEANRLSTRSTDRRGQELPLREPRGGTSSDLFE